MTIDESKRSKGSCSGGILMRGTVIFFVPVKPSGKNDASKSFFLTVDSEGVGAMEVTASIASVRSLLDWLSLGVAARSPECEKEEVPAVLPKPERDRTCSAPRACSRAALDTVDVMAESMSGMSADVSSFSLSTRRSCIPANLCSVSMPVLYSPHSGF